MRLIRALMVGLVVVLGTACSDEAPNPAENSPGAPELAGSNKCSPLTNVARNLTFYLYQGPAISGAERNSACSQVDNILRKLAQNQQQAAADQAALFAARLFADFDDLADTVTDPTNTSNQLTTAEAIALLLEQLCGSGLCGSAFFDETGGQLVDPVNGYWGVRVAAQPGRPDFVLFIEELPPGFVLVNTTPAVLLQGPFYLKVLSSLGSGYTFDPPLEIDLCAAFPPDGPFDSLNDVPGANLFVGKNFDNLSFAIAGYTNPTTGANCSGGTELARAVPGFGGSASGGAVAGGRKAGRSGLDLAGYLGPVGGLVSSTSNYGVVRIASTSAVGITGLVDNCGGDSCEVPGATVTLTCTGDSSPRATVTSNAVGEYFFANAAEPATSCTVAASEGTESGSVTFTVTATPDPNVQDVIIGEPELDLQGLVEQEDCNGSGCTFVASQGATVEIFCGTEVTSRDTQTTNADGNYFFDDIAVDGEVCTIEASKCGFFDNSVEHTFDDSTDPNTALPIQLEAGTCLT